MKKIFAVWTKVKLTKKPDWLDEFKKKYSNPYDFHITLKQMCFIDESELEDIKSLTSKVMNGINFPDHKIEMVFDKIFADNENILIMAQENEKLTELQSKVRLALINYKNYYKPELEEYEKNFKPHLTIAFDLGDKLDEALKDVGKDIECIGEITEVVLSCVKENTIEEARNPDNLIIYKF